MPDSTTRRRIVAATPGGNAALRALAGVFAALVLLALPSAASAAPVNGALKQLPLGSGGCMANGSAAGCRNIVGPLANIGEPAMSPNGRQVYVPGRDSDSLLVFDRDPSSGTLTTKMCFRFTAATGCTTLPFSPLEDATGAVVTPDGKNLFVVGGVAGGSAADGIINFTLAADGDTVVRGLLQLERERRLRQRSRSRKSGHRRREPGRHVRLRGELRQFCGRGVQSHGCGRDQSSRSHRGAEVHQA